MSDGTGGRAASKAGAYGGAEVGGMLGRMVGPPVVGPIVGNLVGEKAGERAARETGLDRAAAQVNKDLASVVGRRRADKVGEIALTALGYSESEKCVCCPCLPASQVLFFLITAFLFFNVYRLETAIEYESSCNESASANASSKVVSVPLSSEESTANDFIRVVSTDAERNITTYLVSYPCQFGFHYLLAGSAVWIAFLPFYICTLFGNCWRQCCCCLCDPIVCFATLFDCFKRCCCECGKFSLLGFIWSSVCVFQVAWSVCGLVWLVRALTEPDQDYLLYDPVKRLVVTVAASACLDFLVAGSELFHKARLHFVHRQARGEQQEEGEETGGEAFAMKPLSTE